MKVAILGYGRQGKKHFDFWNKKATEVDIFTLSGKYPTKEIISFQPLLYKIIIIAISPIEAQESTVEDILGSGYTGYLIIEKPICKKITLLEELTVRPRTIFYIDEVFFLDSRLSFIQKLTTPSINIFAPEKDFLNIVEHSIGFFLSRKDFSYVFENFSITAENSSNQGYQVSDTFGGNILVLKTPPGLLILNNTILPYTFDTCLRGLLRLLQDESSLSLIRQNYFFFRNHYKKI